MNKSSLEETVKILKDMKVQIPLPQAAITQKKRNDALDAAITALNCSEKLNSSDCISRRAAIDSMCELMRHWFGCDSKDEIREIKRELGKLSPAQLEQRWIPCGERLPEEEYVLISKKPKKYFDGGRCVTIAIRMEDPRSRKVNWRDIGFGVIPDDNVLAWMPLPEPYEERRTDETD